MDTIQSWVGIDVSKKKPDIALLHDNQIRPKSLANTRAGVQQFVEWLEFQRIGIETAWVFSEVRGLYNDALATWLYDNGINVSVVNPARVKGYAQSELVRNKTDMTDAATIARFAHAVKPEPWHVPSAEVRVLRALVERLDELKQTRQQELNRSR